MSKFKKMCMLLFCVSVCFILTSCGKTEQAIAVDDMIESIGEVTLDSKDKILEAEKAVEDLSKEDYKQLDKLSVLQAARDKYDELNTCTCDICGEQVKLDECIKTWRNELVCRSCKNGGCKVCHRPLKEGQMRYLDSYVLCSDACVEKACGTLIPGEKCQVCGKEVYSGVNKYFEDNFDCLCHECYLEIWDKGFVATLKDKKTIETDEKQVWLVYTESDSIHFDATYRGTGNCIIKLLDSNQDLVEVVCNEIGDYNVSKTVDGLHKRAAYYVEILCTDGTVSYSWTGTFGQ